jgi:hypothetical protein
MKLLITDLAVAVVQTTVPRWQAIATAGVEQDIVIALRRRVYHAIGNAEWIFFTRQADRLISE